MSALAFDNTYLPVAETRSRAYLDQDKNIREIVNTGARRSTKHDGVPLGLKSGLMMTWNSDGRPFPSGIQSLLHQLRAIEDLQPNWNSYGALPHDPASQKPALDLIFFGHQKCRVPSIIALADGGLGLRWGVGHRELEIDIDPAGVCTAYFADHENDIELETDQSIDVNDAKDWLSKFLR